MTANFSDRFASTGTVLAVELLLYCVLNMNMETHTQLTRSNIPFPLSLLASNFKINRIEIYVRQSYGCRAVCM